ncbi:N-formylglutamate amidohydrolase [Ascidiaceihabitans sp.]|uniref:N-formylglutamate amidohydrolase n=1 Tax=Ascidiaceihabitans sp. TaxID=1872644 RepID=UPI0032992C83
MTFEPFFTHGASRSNPWLITCDHANNTVPDFVNGGDLGLAQADMQRHIAYDIGAAGVTRALADILDAPAILSNFSRLVIDPNRGMDDPTLLMKLYDGTIIPGNRTADDAERQRRINGCYTPYHTAYETLAKRPNTVLVSIHSFTPQLKGRDLRPWEIGVLYHTDTRMALPLMDSLSAALDTPVGNNEPYAGHLPGDAIDQHGLQKNRPNVLIEIRNDLIETEQDQVKWAHFLAAHLVKARAMTDL